MRGEEEAQLRVTTSITTGHLKRGRKEGGGGQLSLELPSIYIYGELIPWVWEGWVGGEADVHLIQTIDHPNLH